jgi:hypothetical protein
MEGLVIKSTKPLAKDYQDKPICFKEHTGTGVIQNMKFRDGPDG